MGNGGELPCFGQQQIAFVLPYFAFDERKQAGFARAVFADKPHALARVDGGGGVVQQDFAAALQGEIFDFYHFDCCGVIWMSLPLVL